MHGDVSELLDGVHGGRNVVAQDPLNVVLGAGLANPPCPRGSMRFCLGGCRLELRLNWLTITAGKVFELKDVT